MPHVRDSNENVALLRSKETPVVTTIRFYDYSFISHSGHDDIAIS